MAHVSPRRDDPTQPRASELHRRHTRATRRGLQATRPRPSQARPRPRPPRPRRADHRRHERPPAQEALIKQEAAKHRRFKPLRKIFEEASDVMLAVCPCWMASSLSVAQLLHSTVKFDYVIFDEASQILPEDAISSIMRSKYVIVAGDNKQLPPTGFFASATDDEEEESTAVGYESLLDMMLPFARGFHLNWHYRSRDESLIAFSNHWMYDDRLITFPGIGGPRPCPISMSTTFPHPTVRKKAQALKSNAP